MRHLLTIFFLCIFVGCREPADLPDAANSTSNIYDQEIEKFQEGQIRFQRLVSIVRDEASFDTAKPKLDLILSEWSEVADSLQKLEPPSNEEKARLRRLIDEGHKNTEPTGEDMLSLISIDSREEAALKWLEDFAAAGSRVGLEVNRLFGPPGYSATSEGVGPDASNGSAFGRSINQALANPAAGQAEPE
ncbi:hypothetical protein [Roseibacillus ishigakijimensis]|uniref:Uncharacterized protein n=1 Tax=Roseibacillus ishigakijimensis TaxID=454146 RepID=A0A934VNU7_9BACT|nr:hypothetical protein [Roseibacillus ishigakijimensis]MBK1835697.1 hypothetical protein [Roseibacillus ishigakijimensis]